MATIDSITLTDANPHPGKIAVVDTLGNAYTGTLSNPQITVADPTQDNVVIDPATPDTVNVNETDPTGGTTAILKLDFTSSGNENPPAGSTAQPIKDGTVFPGLVGQIAIINKVSFNLKLQTTFQ